MNSATGWKIAAMLLGLCCMLLLYRVIDQGITQTYSNSSAESSNRDIKLLRELVAHEWLGLPEEQVMSRLKAYVALQPPNSIVLKRDPEEMKTIYLEGFRFEFREGKLIKVT